MVKKKSQLHARLNITMNLVEKDSYEIELMASKGNSFSLPVYPSFTIGQAGVVLYEANVNFYGSGLKIDIDIGNSGTSDTTITQVARAQNGLPTR